MILNEIALKKALKTSLAGTVFYYFSTEEYLVQNYARQTENLLSNAQDAEITRVEGPAPVIAEIIAAAGTISMFGTKRIVSIQNMEPSAMVDADVAALCDLCDSLENAVIVMTTVFRDDKAKLTKKAKQLIAVAEKNGIAAELVKPQVQNVKSFAIETATALGATLSAAGAAALVDRCGTDYFLLENEIAKLAAACDYGEITPQLIGEFGTQNIEADVFEMVRFVTARQPARALSKLNQLLDLQNEPIAIAAALSSSFIDMYRVKCGAAQRQSYATVFKDFSYRGNDYRLKKSAETAAPYTKEQLEAILQILLTLDVKLKSSAASSTVLLQTALCEMIAAGRRAL
ncbi:MAG: DNA polymerase III subunit delta [Ruthenibacterium sp.]